MRYPGWLVWPLAAAALLAVVLLAVIATRRAQTTWKRVAAGFSLGLIPSILAPVAAQRVWTLLAALRPGRLLPGRTACPVRRHRGGGGPRHQQPDRAAGIAHARRRGGPAHSRPDRHALLPGAGAGHGWGGGADTDTGQARWVSSESDPGEWTGTYVTGREDLSESFPLLGDDVATGPAQAALLPPPALTVVSDCVAGRQRTITLRLTAQRAVRLVYLLVRRDPAAADGGVVRANVAGRDRGSRTSALVLVAKTYTL